MKKTLFILLLTSFNLFATQPPVRSAAKASLKRTKAVLEKEEEEEEEETSQKVKLPKKTPMDTQVATSMEQTKQILEEEEKKDPKFIIQKNNIKIHRFIKYRHVLRKGLQLINASRQTFPPFTNSIEQEIFLIDAIERATGIISFYIQQNKFLREQIEKE